MTASVTVGRALRYADGSARGLLHHHTGHSHKDRPRFTFGSERKDTEFVFQRPHENSNINDDLLISNEWVKSPVFDATYYLGAKGSDAAWRLMDKQLDRQHKSAATRITLPDRQLRTRIEVTLQTSELRRLGIQDLEDLPRFKFGTLQASHFKFMLPTFRNLSGRPAGVLHAIDVGLENERRSKFLKTGVVGLSAMEDALGRHRTANREKMRADFRSRGKKLKAKSRVGIGRMGTLMAFDELNRRVEWALRHLGERVAAQ